MSAGFFILLAAAIRVAGDALYVGFVVELVGDVRDGRRDQTVSDLFSSAAPYILPLVGFGILAGIGIAIGFVLIIVPGLILLTFWSVGAPRSSSRGSARSTPSAAAGDSSVAKPGRSSRAPARLPDRDRGRGRARCDRRRNRLRRLIVAAIVAAAITAPVYALASASCSSTSVGARTLPTPWRHPLLRSRR